MDANTLYWFFSTVAQTLAALIALVGIAIVFRMERLSNSITTGLELNRDLIGHHLKTVFEPDDVVLTELRDYCNNELANHENGIRTGKPYEFKIGSLNYNGLNALAQIRRLGRLVKMWEENESIYATMKKSLVRFLVTASFMIFLSLSFLPITERLQHSYYASTLLVTLIILISTISIILAGWLFYNFLGETLLGRTGNSQ
jgi:hypothetical protein